jgi:UDP-N-acetylmuramate dehydrogenase
MMAARQMPGNRMSGELSGRLPPARGRLKARAPLAPFTWFRVGGPAEMLFRPADAADLAQFLAACPADIPVTVIGAASNLLIRDGGLAGVVIRLGGELARVRVDGTCAIVGAGALDTTVAAEAGAAGLGGLEFLSGIPGTIGGAVRMNAGAYGREIVDVIESATLATRAGEIMTVPRDGLGLRYRGSGLPEGAIVVEAALRAEPAAPDRIAARMSEVQARRAATQPVRARTGGSTFANPPVEAANGAKAWELIDRAGCRGLRLGGAQVSEQHCNFLINTGEATAADLEALGEEVRRRVRDATGVTLTWEIMRIGSSA